MEVFVNFYKNQMDPYHWHRTSRKLVDIEWLKESVQQINSGMKLKDICKKARLNNGTFREISKTMFKKLVRENNLELIPKRGRKQIEINLDACQAYANLKDLMPDAGINKIIQKMKTDLVNIEKNPEEFQKIQSEIQKNGEINYESGNWLDEVDRTTLVPVVTPIEGTPIEINPLRESLQTATYITKNFDSPSYRMGRKIHEAIIADTPPQNQKNQQKYIPRNYLASKCHQIWHADIHYWRKRIGKYLFAIIDDRSRKIIDFNLFTEKTAQNTTAVLKRALSTLPQPPYAIWTDNGLENKSSFHQLLVERGIEHIFIQPGNPQANGKIERWWPYVERNCKSESDLPRVIRFYNNMPHSSLPVNPETNVYFTPNEFEASEIDDHWYRNPEQEPFWIVDGQLKNLKESIDEFRK